MRGESHISKEGNHSSEMCIESAQLFFFFLDWFKGKPKASLGNLTEKKICKLKELGTCTIMKI